MGNNCCVKVNSITNTENLSKFLTDAINSNSLSTIEKIVIRMTELNINIDSDLISLDSSKINCITYSFFKGNKKLFEYFLKQGALIELMHKTLDRKLNIDPIYHICSNGYYDMLVYYLPIYLLVFNNKVVVDETAKVNIEG